MGGKQGDEGTMMPDRDSEWPHDDSIKVEQKGREYRWPRLQPSPGCFSFHPEDLGQEEQEGRRTGGLGGVRDCFVLTHTEWILSTV